MHLDYPNVCRLCAGSCQNSIPIFEKTGLLDLAEKINSYLHVEIENTRDDECHEPRMCNSCHDKIVKWDLYAEQVRKVQEMFMRLATSKENADDDDDDDVEKLSEATGLKGKDKLNITPIEKSVTDESPSLKRSDSAEKKSTGKGKRKNKVVKKKKKISIVENKESDFSDGDNIPLANHLDCAPTESLKNKSKKEKHTKKVKPRIRLKIKPIKEREEPEENVVKPKSDEDIVKDEEGEEDVEEENSSGEDGDDFKDEDTVKMGGLQSLFTWVCLECQAPVKNWNALVKHCKEVHESNASVQCVCGKFLQSRASIMKHRMKHTIGYGYKCEYENCNKTFHRQQLLDVHSLSHMPKELQPWMCCKCSRRFHTESLLKQHEKVHLPKEEKLIHPCEVCQKKFCSKSAVSAHIRAVHFGERPFVCDQCGHSFTSKGILHEHLTIHSDVYNFHCKDCNKSFKTKYRLKIHMDTHVETRYQCPICTLTLNTRRTLRMHLLVHREDKAFQCTTCGKAFKRSKDLKNHYNLHTGRRPYMCPFCQRTFANGSNCRSHKRRMHPEELKMYEAALAAGQQPVVFRIDNQSISNRIDSSQAQNGGDFQEDSNESKSDVSDLKCDGQKYSDEDVKPVSLVSYSVKSGQPEIGANGVIENPEKLKLLSPGAIPLNLQRNNNSKRIKEEEGKEVDENGLVDSMGSNGGENVTPNFAQIAFGNHTQNVQYPVHSFYTFQSGGIPAFPGNPFFRQ